MKYIIIFLFLIIIFYFTTNIVEKFETNKYIEKKYPLKYKILNNFIEKEDAEYIINKCKNFLQDSTIISDNNTKSNWRTSKTAIINDILGYHDTVLVKLINKVAKMFDITPYYIEDINLTYYSIGDRYKHHHDYFKPNEGDKEKQLLKKYGQRMKTIFVYLKNATEGGETYFPIENKKFKLEDGDALLWENAYIKNNICYMNTNSLHEGLPPIKGEKYGLNIWITEKGNRTF
tara:strand:- start:1464 stop:2159 length:696 start_codon:yes stop_codon:yes gene_type:complete